MTILAKLIETLVILFNLHCKDNIWRLTLVGTINSIGLFIGLPIAGILSDRFGRKLILIGTLVLSGICGLVRSFTHTYIFFLVMEFLDSVFGAGAYAAAFILGLELVGSNKRILVGLLINMSYSAGGIIEGAFAWLFESWRPLLQVLYALPLVCICYYWFVPESVKWLLSKKRYTQAEQILQNLAKVNKKTISKDKIHKLCLNSDTDEIIKTHPFRDLCSSSILILRFVNCSLCWVACIFVYNGLTINSVALSGNSYLDFILTMFVELPGALVAFFVVDRLGRKLTFAAGFFISAVSCICTIFVPPELYSVKLIVYLLGKFGISVNMSVIYIFTSEMFPTPLRNSLVSMCSMFGRIGAMIAPQIPLLEATWQPLPLVLFGASSVVAGFLALLLPETMNLKLPDTITEAENIKKQKNSKNKNIIENTCDTTKSVP
ncbi:hypothetical protein FQA39_LY04869 [Lamprigera yunnana]|nr:hypothetical protein FQA39_LY04869 [Lamprigera yunnana]